MKIYDKTTQTYKELVLKPGGDTLPIGAILPFSSDTIPNGWLLCDGSSFSATSYPELFDVIGVTYGWDDDRNPKLPDLRGRVAVGKKDATSADDTEFSSLGNTGGEKEHTLTVSEMPSHTHNDGVLSNEYFGEASGSNSCVVKVDKTLGSTSASGGGQPHNNLQPYLVTNYIIKAKNTVVVKGEVIQETGTASETNVYSSVAVDNKISEEAIDSYSTKETKINKVWINGKPIYRKVFQFIADNHNYIYTHNTPNVEFITDAYGMSAGYPIPYSSVTSEYIIEIWTEPTRFGIKTGTSIDLNRTYYITLEYTKTTD